MDKYEYKLRSDEIKQLIKEREYAEAAEIADTIDWKRVKSVTMLDIISDLYKLNRRYEDSKNILLLAYERKPSSRDILYSLCELSIKLKEGPVQALNYYNEFCRIAPNDSGQYILQYKLYEMQEVPLEERIEVLEKYNQIENRERWAYELATLYHKNGQSQKCIEECDRIFTWFGHGKYVEKALELKLQYTALTEEQKRTYFGEQPEVTVKHEEEIQVKTVDDSPYNTINLQKELAASMKDILRPEDEQAVILEAQEPEATVEDTEISDSVEDGLVQEECLPEERVAEVPQAQSVMEKTVVDSSNEDFEEPEETKVLPKIGPEFLAEVKPELTKEELQALEDARTSAANAAAAIEEMKRQTIENMNKPSGYDDILSQEYDGQISLAVTEENMVEKQITGQISITEWMEEWEKVKRANEEKRRLNLQQRVLEETGELFEQFDEEAKSGVLAHLEELAEAYERSEKVKSEEAAEEPAFEEIEEISEEEAEETVTETEDAAEEEEDNPKGVPEMAENSIEGDVEWNNTSVAETIDSKVVHRPDVVNRKLSAEEKELFGNFIQGRKSKEQLVAALDSLSMASYTGNAIITGEAGMGTIRLAKKLMKSMQQADSNFSGRTAQLSADSFNEKDPAVAIEKLSGGAMIVTEAGNLTNESAARLCKALNREEQAIIVILEDRKRKIEQLLERCPFLEEIFNARIDLEALDNDSLVNFAKMYAREMEYSIDDFGVLALHTRISESQTIDHSVTVNEVKDMVDDAIYHANKKSLRHFMDVVLRKRYDKEDMIILTERDFVFE